MSGFGRKGIGEGAAAGSGTYVGVPMGQRSGAPMSAAVDPLAAKREAFLASERARRAQSDATEPADPETMLRSTYRPHANRPVRSVWMAYLLWFLLAQVSAHRFYLGATQSAIAQTGMFFGGLLLILMGPPILYLGAASFFGWALWVLADVFLIPGVHRKYAVSPTNTAAVFS
ncbi:MAG: TM2 domain-containing protein [Sphingopyxis sp.]|nr:TM2 domain-containing protein [Sphingopyxis sp.]